MVSHDPCQPGIAFGVAGPGDFITSSFCNSIRAKNIGHLRMHQSVVSLESRKLKQLRNSLRVSPNGQRALNRV